MKGIGGSKGEEEGSGLENEGSCERKLADVRNPTSEPASCSTARFFIR